MTMLRPLAVFLLLLLASPSTAAPRRCDVLVYGGTAGGAVAAVAAAREGLDVVLLEPRRHIGGMLSGGLGRTDMDRQQHVIGGMARQFFVEAGRHYGEPIAWTFEPRVAERILRDWLREAGVEVLFEHRLDTVRKDASRITAVRALNGAEFQARAFVDSSYEGDLMARAGVSYTVGREGRDEYGEPLAGRKEIQPGNHQFAAPVSPYDDDGNLLPYVQSDADLGEVGSGDRKVQAYCFRLCLTDVEGNRIPISRPDDYDPARYELLRRYIQSLSIFKERRSLLGISPIPNGKTDLNSGPAVSTNLPCASWEYPEASDERREEIWREHLSWTQGLLYFMGNDPGVPADIRAEVGRWGLARDEFTDTGGWPHQLYVREARRMLGEYVMTQHDLETRRTKYDSIGMGGYNMDVREVQWVAHTVYRFPMPTEEVLMEGYITVPVEPYEIPYRSLLPRLDEAENLLVTSCVSASHMAYSSLRMEPQYMIMGHAAGVASALAVLSDVAVHRVDLARLQGRLREQGQILSLDERSPLTTTR
jgi:hypothetical protein